jgi:hypothetical protein
MATEPDLLTRHEAAVALGMTVWGVDYHRHVGNLKWLTNKPGNVRISRKEIARFIAARNTFQQAS